MMLSTKRSRWLVASAVLALSLSACSERKQPTAKEKPFTQSQLERGLIPSDYAPGEITRLCDEALDTVMAQIASIKALSDEDKKNFTLTHLAFETAMADFTDKTSPLTFMGYVSESETLRDEGTECEAKLGDFYPTLISDRDLYLSLKDAEGANAEEKRLASETLRSFELNGMHLNDADLAQLKKLNQDLSKLETEFSSNLNEDVSSINFTEAELQGVSQAFLNRLTRNPDGTFKVTTKSTDYVQVMENAVSADTRKKMLFAYQNRAPENTALLEQAIQIRQQIAKLLGYDTWADAQIVGRMAPDAKTVLDFLTGLKDKLAERNKQDLDKLLAYKRELDPSATSVEIWDVSFLANGLKKRDFSLDDEKIAEYFPADTVMKGMFEIYSKLLGVTYEKVEDAKVWSPGVNQYKVIDNTTNSVVAYFYSDTIPREGKYGHAAAFPLIAGRRLADGSYSVPVASIVANFTPPANGKPSLLLHDEVSTLFHEFGHIMQQVLTRAPYASLSGTSVARDYVEAPSQMLENWVWNSDILDLISGHYETGEKLPADLRTQMIAAKNFNQGYAYTRQLVYGLFDMKIHSTDGPVDVTKIFEETHLELHGIPAIEGGHFPAGFGHMMGGYDAGYYGYLWSEVYAQDMFSRFETEGLLNETAGRDYRRLILEQGNMTNALELITQFLGRAPTFDAFYRALGIQ